MADGVTTARTTSIIIPAHGDWDKLEILLARLDVVPGRTIIVVDDASPEDGASRLPPRPDLSVIVRQRNGGFAAAVNSGLEAAEGEVLAVLNSDLVVEEDVLASLVSHALRGDVICAPDLLEGTRRRSPARIELRRRHDVAEALLPLRVLPGRAGLAARGYVARSSSPVITTDWVAGACMVFSRSVVDRVGPFDERFFMNAEEQDWQRRARMLGIRSQVLCDLVAVHAEGSAVLSSDKLATRCLWGWRARILYVAKWDGERTARRLQRLLMIVNVLNKALVAVAARFRPGSPALTAARAFCRGLDAAAGHAPDKIPLSVPKTR